MKQIFILIGFLCISMSLHAGWIVNPETIRIGYSTKQGEGYDTFDEALKSLSANDSIQKLNGIEAYWLLGCETLQKEVFTALERDAPRELKEALKSSGNMHNPKMQQLWKPFEKALLAAPTINKLNGSLASYGLTISRAGVEKFELRSTLADSNRRFHGLLWLYITKSLPHPTK